MIIQFTGSKIQGLGHAVSATCLVRNELNGWRLPNEVLREKDGRISRDGTPYQPRPFPRGRWRIVEVVDMPVDSLYWPVLIRTNAWQWLNYWHLNENGCYDRPTGKRFRARGYAAHYARVKSGGELVRSNTTLGCINATMPDGIVRLGGEIRDLMDAGKRVYIDVPPWKKWEE
jgi:hypothetical protein